MPFHLLGDVFWISVLPWLALRDVVRLDTVATTADRDGKLRKQLHQKIKNLVLEGCDFLSVGRDGLKWMINRQVGLRRFSMVEYLHFKDRNGLDVILASVEYLMLYAFNHSSPLYLLEMVQYCPNLLELDIHHCNRVLNDLLVTLISALCPLLQRLNLSNCRRLTDSGIRALAQNCNDLKILSLEGVFQITDTGIRAIANNCSQLTTIDISLCERVTDTGFRHLVQSCPVLNTINISECENLTGEAIAAIGQHCHHLSSLSMQGIGGGLTVECMSLLARGPSSAANAPATPASADTGNTGNTGNAGDTDADTATNMHLTSLDVSFNFFLSDEMIMAVAKHCKQLKSLDISGCEELTDKCINALVDNHIQLQSIGLVFNSDALATSTAVIELFKNSPNMLEARISNFGGDINGVVRALATYCLHLQTFTTMSNVNLETAAMLDLVRNCPQLKYIDVRSCVLLTDDFIVALSQHCPSLQTVYCFGCPLISKTALSILSDAGCRAY
mmetsp:Transcript_4912/g.7988  ORF Transcript_4912/g.7988 Transcript_4912/m.7988 type:complete len:503 (-) Transcript_4912:210-1718(-)